MEYRIAIEGTIPELNALYAELFRREGYVVCYDHVSNSRRIGPDEVEIDTRDRDAIVDEIAAANAHIAFFCTARGYPVKIFRRLQDKGIQVLATTSNPNRIKEELPLENIIQKVCPLTVIVDRLEKIATR